MASNSRILITGGSGFIGSWLIRHLLSAQTPVEITNLDLLTYAGNPENLKDVQHDPRYRFVQGDICDEALVGRLMADADICVNVAAQTHVDRSISGPGEFIRTNVLGTQVLLEAARNNRIQKFVHISTDEVYGSIEGTQKFTETSPLDPSSPYSSSKAAADLIALSYWKTYGLPVCITRCTNNYGPNQYPEKLIPLFILNASNDQPVPVYGDGLNVRDWIHVKDHSAGVSAVIEHGQPGQVYNIGSGNEYNNLEITRLILKTLGKPEQLIRFVTDRLGHDRRYALDATKITRELGWSNTIAFEQGLMETIEWYQKNAEWVDGVRQREQHQVAASVSA
ncbi:dTDP-glucose 4,6-dehydratase [Vampirovibrio sp.]|uniref:dTDP-glucose 4,6-dehydratase n=1 Tax=Vampirovibrio sp. TaxID=2717857 RepID=UPI003593CC56